MQSSKALLSHLVTDTCSKAIEYIFGVEVTKLATQPQDDSYQPTLPLYQQHHTTQKQHGAIRTTAVPKAALPLAEALFKCSTTSKTGTDKADVNASNSIPSA